MKIIINMEVITKLNPCKDRFDNWKIKYPNYSGDIIDFLKLPNITHLDKLWVALKLIPLETRAIFALDCNFAAYADATDAVYVAAYDADAAAYAAAYDADAAAYAAAAYAAANAAYDYAAAHKKEQENQIEALIYLIKRQ